MNKKEIQRVERTVSRWQTVMGLGGVTLSNYFSDEESSSIAEVVTAWEYQQAGIIWFSQNVIELSQQELDEAAVHELGHILVAPMSDHLPEEHHKLEEFTVTAITKAILGVRNGLRN
jgi:hypothetical protein